MKIRFLKDHQDMDMYGGGGDATDYCRATGKYVWFHKGEEFTIISTLKHGFLIKLNDGRERFLSNGHIGWGTFEVI